MPSKPVSAPPSASTRLTNLRLGAESAAVEIDGKSVQLAGEQAKPAVEAFRSFYQEAYRAYGLAPEAQAEQSQKSGGWWQRLRGWLARLLGGTETQTQAEPPSWQAAGSSAARPAAAITRPDEPAFKTTESKVRSAPALATKAEPAALAATAAPTAAKGDPNPELKTPAPPRLMAAFADEKGVHLLWNLTPEAGKDQLKERSYGFGTPVADRLQDCYSRLAGLGYEVVDLKVWQPAPDPATPVRDAPSPGARSPAAAPQASAGGRADRIVRLLPADSDHPARIALEPIEGDLTPLALSENPKRVAALHAAADAGQPADKRLTFLKVSFAAKGGPKLTGYATGKDPQADHAWKAIEELLGEAAAGPKAAKVETKPKAEPKPAAKSEPKAGPAPAPEESQPELLPGLG